MTASLVAPVIPSTARPGRRGEGGPVTARRLPLASPRVALALPGEVMYGLGRVDASGRVVDRAVLGALGWCHGDRLTVTADAAWWPHAVTPVAW
jgi:hypothetical protein